MKPSRLISYSSQLQQSSGSVGMNIRHNVFPRRGLMKATSRWLFVLVVAVAAGMFVANGVRRADGLNGAKINADAAFRDGLFIGRLDAQSGRQPHLASGRWQSDSDRRSFVTGYLRAHRDT